MKRRFDRRIPRIARARSRVVVLVVLSAVYAACAFGQGNTPSASGSGLLMLRLEAAGYPSEIQPGTVKACSFPLSERAGARKSPFLAGALSLVLPGAGEVYAGQYVLAAAFVGAEAACWYFRFRYDRKGDDQTKFYQAFADANWSVVKYAEWLNAHAKEFPGGENTQPITILPDPENRLKPWERVDWAELNAVELAIPVFSHRLPSHGEQQYYELIGKYDQYSYGWADKNEGYYREISPMFRSYAGMRGKANDLYATADLFLNLVVVNHVLSAIDAAWAAARFNKAIGFSSRGSLRFLPDGRVVIEPMAVVTFRF
ncbi:MAG: hypothetical protein QHI48_12640 [Bacteroidota bacterium]|nr:hypothetical protein [Bacteroidota bacterium]